MQRRTFLGTATAIGALAGFRNSAVAAPAPAAGTRELTMIMTWPKKTPGLADSAEQFAANVTTLTRGELTVKLFGAGEIVPAFESLDAVSLGVADLCHSTPLYWAGKHPAFNYFGGVPFGFAPHEMAAWIRYGGGQALWNELGAEFGVYPLFAGTPNPQPGGWFRKEINTPEDFKGLKMRQSGLGGEVLRRMGATTVLTPPSEIAPALFSGAVDAAEFGTPWNDLVLGLYRAADYYYMPGLLEPGTAIEILVNAGVYGSLSAEHRIAVSVAAAGCAHDLYAMYTVQNAAALDTLLREHNVQLRHFSEDIIRTMAAQATEVVAELGRSGPLASKIHQSFSNFLKSCRTFAPNAEGGYLSARSRFA